MNGKEKLHLSLMITVRESIVDILILRKSYSFKVDCVRTLFSGRFILCTSLVLVIRVRVNLLFLRRLLGERIVTVITLRVRSLVRSVAVLCRLEVLRCLLYMVACRRCWRPGTRSVAPV